MAPYRNGERVKQRIHDIVYSCDSRDELAERIVRIEDENAELRLLVKGLIWCDNQEYNEGDCIQCLLNHGHITRIGRCRHVAKKLGIELGE